jgi:hypothetical protein
MMTRRLVLSFVLCSASAAFAQQDAQTIEDQVHLCEVEAPPFKESKRAELYAKMFRELGLRWRSSDYSCLSAVSGSTRDARSAGR